MAGTLFRAWAHSPSQDDPLVATQDWEFLSMSTMSASTLLAHGHALGFGLPPPSTPGLHISRTEEDAASRRDGDADTEKGFVFRSSLPLDVSQIAVICTSSTASVEPFTEGWKPQFRIAGAPLQEDYYAPDPFSTATSNTGSSLEPFLDMEQSFSKESTIAPDEEAFLDKKKTFHPPENIGNSLEFLQKQEINEGHLVAHDKVPKVVPSTSDLVDSGKASTRRTLTAQGVGPIEATDWEAGKIGSDVSDQRAVV